MYSVCMFSRKILVYEWKNNVTLVLSSMKHAFLCIPIHWVCIWDTIVQKKFNGKIFSSLTLVNENLTHKIFSTTNNWNNEIFSLALCKHELDLRCLCSSIFDAKKTFKIQKGHYLLAFHHSSQKYWTSPRYLSGRWPMIVPFFFTAIAYLLLSLSSSLLHWSSSPVITSQRFL